MTNVDILKTDISLYDHVSKRLGQKGKKDGDRYFFKSGNEKTASLAVWQDNSKGYKDFSERLGAGTIIDFEMHFQNIEMKESIKFLLDMYNIKDEKRELKKSPKQIDLVENFENYRFKEGNALFQRFLGTRGVSIDTIKIYKENLNRLVKELAFCEGLALGNSDFKDCMVFPCYDSNFEIIGAKLRRLDGEKIGTVKSKTIKGTSTGILYNPEDLEDTVYICEGETDYIILKMLGFTSVIGNLGGVASNADKIQGVVKKAKQIVCLYDNDEAGLNGAKKLEEKIGRPVRLVKYDKIDGIDKYDINDLFNQGWNKDDFTDLLNSSYIQKEEVKNEGQNIFNNRFFYNDIEMKYFDLLRYKLIGGYDIAEHLCIKPGDIKDMRKSGDIPTYKGVCYYKGGKEGFYNLMDEGKILKPSNNPNFDERIKFLLQNLCNYDEKNLDWLLRYIHYKYHNINDVLIPAIIFHGVGGTGKGLLELLNCTIYGDKNVQVGLNQRSLKSSFSEYRGEKIMVFFNEVGSGNEQIMKDISLKVKSMIMERTITVERKGQDAYSIENIAGFIFASNDAMPLKLDSTDTGNRRFTVIRTGKFIPREQKDGSDYDGIYGIDIAKAVSNKEVVSDFLAYLDDRFGKNPKGIQALDNEDKKLLEKAGQSAGDSFFEWFEDKYPNIKKISIKEKEYFLGVYRNEIGSNYTEDRLYSPRSFNHSLGVKYIYKNVNIRNSSCKGYYIDKDVDGDGFFEKEIYEEENLPF